MIALKDMCFVCSDQSDNDSTECFLDTVTSTVSVPELLEATSMYCRYVTVICLKGNNRYVSTVHGRYPTVICLKGHFTLKCYSHVSLPEIMMWLFKMIHRVCHEQFHAGAVIVLSNCTRRRCHHAGGCMRLLLDERLVPLHILWRDTKRK